MWDSATIFIKDVKGRTALVEREAQERVLRVETENATALAFSREDEEGLVRKITLLDVEIAEA
jgi:hypothetical protein